MTSTSSLLSGPFSAPPPRKGQLNDVRVLPVISPLETDQLTHPSYTYVYIYHDLRHSLCTCVAHVTFIQLKHLLVSGNIPMANEARMKIHLSLCMSKCIEAHRESFRSIWIRGIKCSGSANIY